MIEMRFGFDSFDEAARVVDELCHAFMGSDDFVHDRIFISDPVFDEVALLWYAEVFIDRVKLGDNCASTELYNNEQDPDLKNDPVNSPSHYTKGDVECIDGIKSALSKKEYRGYLRGNALKYIWRCMDKGNAVQDLDKAVWYISRLKKELE